jgi:adenylosuccinate synthase
VPAYVVVGAQWGDEGKGKVVDLLTERVDIVARYGGGPNAGHTICVGDRRFALHHVPSGILREGVLCVIGNGVVIEPASLLKEIEDLRRSGIRVEDNLRISDRAHLILPYHRGRDIAREESARDGRIGTTRLGVGPTYEGKAARHGLRVADLADPQALSDRIRAIAAAVAAGGGGLPAEFNPPAEQAARDYQAHGAALRPFIADTATLLNHRLDGGAVVLCEGAQGTMLDLDHGGYPYVTSSTSTAGGACTGLGISPVRVAGVIGVMKAYSTRVGEGPMPTEQDNPTGDRIRQRGREFGSTTGRPRRCGWFDAVVARYAVMVNRIETVALTLFDVLDDFDHIPIGVAYECDGRRIDTLPGDPAVVRRCRPIYETLPGWRSDTSGVTREADLPPAARDYVRRIEALVGSEVGIISASPQRDRTIIRPEGRIAAWLPRRPTA